ncbi:3-hydroxyacyl-CoA dehydrogenase [Roseibacterium elongatum DSM 19469]|uniref:L-carnitine dehydrogenase n=1 Tax=Roseicyclus elongatus DSM 19469 TaxID=1294273 RepID=W8S810_9RHOB|nr:carnitine 3-dehydrogenase [Roseibacterium elongatum]AHM05081.1 3-hydroxyacyl-CoA dehydrogenase [Roseibacterium elongatum DSM 19469]
MRGARKAAIVGGGVIGGGWAARFLLNGWDVAVFDPDPEAERKIGEVLANARRSLPSLYDRALPPEGRLSFHDDLAEAVTDTHWVQESVPERLDLKHAVHADLTRFAPEMAVIGSSTSGFKPSDLAREGASVIVAHPFNPVYLLPLVELVGAADHRARASAILREVGMFPLNIRHEIDAHIADRLLEAVWRESLWLVQDDVATTQEIDEAIRMGFGLRWAQMGLFETYRIAGGEAGMAHFMAQFGPALRWPWTKLTDVPDLTQELVDQIAAQSDAQSGHMSIRELERLRDDNLVGILRTLKRSQSGAGATITAHEAALPAPLTVRRRVPQSWADAQGRVSEAQVLRLAAQAQDRLRQVVGCDVAGGVADWGLAARETALCHTHGLSAGDNVSVDTHVVRADGIDLRLRHRIAKDDGTLCATVESGLVHVDLATGAPCFPPQAVAARLRQMAGVPAVPPDAPSTGQRPG